MSVPPLSNPEGVSEDHLIRIFLTREKQKRTLSVNPGDTVLDLLSSLKIHPDGVLVFSENEPIPLDENVEGMDELKIVNVASGG